MKKITKTLVIFWGMFASSFALADEEGQCTICNTPKPIVYVKAGASGNGTHANPYGTLAAAQTDPTWRTLIVLYSASPLDGGILLKNGQTLIGDENGPQPIISNSSSSSNGGNGVLVQSGTVCIQNLMFQNTISSAIRYDNAENITITKVNATLWNQGLLVLPHLPFIAGNIADPSPIPPAAIEGQVNNCGTTKICKTTVTGPGNNALREEVYGSAERKLSVSSSDLSGIGTTYLSPPADTFSRPAAMVGSAYGPNAKLNIKVENTRIHDFTNTPLSSTIANYGFAIAAIGGGLTEVNSKKSKIENITGGLIGDNHGVSSMILIAQTNPPPFSITPGIIDADIKNNSFDETLGINSLTSRENIFFLNNDGKLKVSTTQNQIKNLRVTIGGIISGIAQEKTTIANNLIDSSGVIDGGAMYNPIALPDFFFIPGSTVSSSMMSAVIIKNNNYLSGTGGPSGADVINILGNLAGTTPWQSLSIEMKNNCLDGTAGGFAALFNLGNGFPLQATGLAQIKARNNNFTNFALDIVDDGAGINYDAKQNFWVPPAIPGVTVFVAPPSTVDVSAPLAAPIACPGV